MMKIFIDESGNDGQLDKQIVFDNNKRYFSIGLVIVNEQNISILDEKYRKFKEKFEDKLDTEGEIKGSKMMVKNNNDILDYFIDNFLNDKDFYICIYDRFFFLSTRILFDLLTPLFHKEHQREFYLLASNLSEENEIIFSKYLEVIETNSRQSFENFLLFIIGHHFEDSILGEELKDASKKILSNNEFIECIFDDMCDRYRYQKKTYINAINASALFETLDTLFIFEQVEKEEVLVVHDEIQQFQGFMEHFSEQFGIKIKFENGKSNNLLQLADNIASISRKISLDIYRIIRQNKLFDIDNSTSYQVNLFSKVVNKLGTNNFKYTVPIHDHASFLVVNEMFSTVPKYSRNQAVFQHMFVKAYDAISKELDINIEKSSVLKQTLYDSTIKDK